MSLDFKRAIELVEMEKNNLINGVTYDEMNEYIEWKKTQSNVAPIIQPTCSTIHSDIIIYHKNRAIFRHYRFWLRNGKYVVLENKSNKIIKEYKILGDMNDCIESIMFFKELIENYNIKSYEIVGSVFKCEQTTANVYGLEKVLKYYSWYIKYEVKAMYGNRNINIANL